MSRTLCLFAAVAAAASSKESGVGRSDNDHTGNFPSAATSAADPAAAALAADAAFAARASDASAALLSSGAAPLAADVAAAAATAAADRVRKAEATLEWMLPFLSGVCTPETAPCKPL